MSSTIAPIVLTHQTAGLPEAVSVEIWPFAELLNAYHMGRSVNGHCHQLD